MSAYVAVPVVALVLGALAYGFSANPKVAEVGRITFAAALLALLLGVVDHAVRLPG